MFIKFIYIEYFWSFRIWHKNSFDIFCRRHVDIIAYPFESKVAGLMTQQYFTLAFLLSSVLPVCAAQWDHIISEGAFLYAWISVFKRNIITFLVLSVALWFFQKLFYWFKKEWRRFQKLLQPIVCGLSRSFNAGFLIVPRLLLHSCCQNKLVHSCFY